MKVSTHINVFNFKPFVNSYSFAFIMNSQQARYRLSLVPGPAALHFFKRNKEEVMTLTDSCKALSDFLFHCPYLPIVYGVDDKADDGFCFACDMN